MNTKTFKLVQFSSKDAWQKWCQEGLTPEESAIVMGENPWESKEELLKRKTGQLPIEKPETTAMIKGKETRPLAIKAYKELYKDINLNPCNAQNISTYWLRATIDLLSTENMHIAEIRCGQGAYDKIKNSTFPPKPYWAEAQHILATTGLKYINLFFFSPNLEEKPIEVKVWRKEEYISRLLREGNLFMEEVSQNKQVFNQNVSQKSLDKKSETETSEMNPEYAAKKALETEKESALRVYKAILGQSYKVDKETYTRFVPSHFDKKGNLTTLGKLLLLQA